MRKKLLISLIVVFLLGAVTIGVYRVVFVWLIRVPTGSMANTILPGDHLVVHRLLGDIKRGDIVAFRYSDKSEYYVSRVIGLPDESIQLRGKFVYINDRMLDEHRVMVEPMHNGYDPLTELSTEGTGPYSVYYTKRFHSDEEYGSGDFGVDVPFKIPADHYFLLGDNRDNSEDSRYRGPAPRNLIWGKPSIIYTSVTLPNEDSIRTERIFKRMQ